MKKTLLSFGACLAFFAGTAQTTIFSEDFEGGAGGFTLNTGDLGGTVGVGSDNYWVVNNVYTGGTATIQFCTILIGTSVPVGNVDPQPAGISSANGNYLHMLSEEAAGSGILNANYAAAVNIGGCFPPGSHFVSMTNDIVTTPFTGVTLDFWWLNDGDNPNALGEVYYSTDGGTTWVQKTGTTYQGITTWTNETLTDGAWDGQASLRFGFRFNNLVATAAADPGFSLDDIVISGNAGACSDSFSSFAASGCNTYTVPSGDETYTTAGTSTVMDTILNVTGCDSIMTITLTINSVDASVTDNLDGTATANSSTGTYQWLTCDTNTTNFTVIAGATAATYAPPSTGTFALEVTDNGCVDTSACMALLVGGFGEFESNFNVYPNPTTGQFTIDFGSYGSEINIVIADLSGQIIFSKNGFIPQQTELINLDVAPGVYMISIKAVGSDMIRQSRITVK